MLHSDRVSLAAFPETAGTAAPAESLRNSNIASTLAERQPGSDSHRYDTCPPILHLNRSQLRQVENRVDARSALGIRMAGEGRGWIYPELFTPRWAGRFGPGRREYLSSYVASAATAVTV